MAAKRVNHSHFKLGKLTPVVKGKRAKGFNRSGKGRAGDLSMRAEAC